MIRAALLRTPLTPPRTPTADKLSSLEFSVPFGTMKVYGAGRAPATRFLDRGSPCPRGARDSLTQMRRWTGHLRCSGRAVRGRHAPGADPSHGDQPAESLRRLREQGAVVPQGPRPLPNGAPVVPDRGPEEADRPSCGRGNLLGIRQDAARPGQTTRVHDRIRGARVRG